MPTVLVVDDNSDIVSAVSEALTEEGWDVVAVLSAKEATPAAQSRKIDVVLCDVLLGDGTDGPDLREYVCPAGARTDSLRLRDGFDAGSGQARR